MIFSESYLIYPVLNAIGINAFSFEIYKEIAFKHATTTLIKTKQRALALTSGIALKQIVNDFLQVY